MFSLVKLSLITTARTDWALEVPVGTSKEDLTDPKHYVEMSGRLQVQDLKPIQYPHIHITDVEGNFFAEVVVVGNKNNKIKTELLSYVEIQPSGTAADDLAKPKEKTKKKVKSDYTEEAFEAAKDASNPYFLKWNAGKKWTIVNKFNGKIEDHSADKVEIFTSLQGYL